MRDDASTRPDTSPTGGTPAMPSAAFRPTRWTLIQRARGESPEARAALGELCESYYPPVLGFLRREGRDAEAARELTQEFFARVLAGSGFNEADPERGRFRSYLLGALKHFLADRRKHDLRLKRGGGVAAESLQAAGLEEESNVSPFTDAVPPMPDAGFDREWALAVMGRAIDTLQKEFQAAGKTDQFDNLKPWLMGEAPSMSQANAARQLGLSEGAVKVIIHRLRKRFRDAVRAEISHTLRDPSPALVDEELQHLIAALT